MSDTIDNSRGLIAALDVVAVIWPLRPRIYTRPSILFKEDITKVVQEISMEIRGAHYPLYTSKYNPIESSLLPHLTRVYQGVIFSSVALVQT